MSVGAAPDRVAAVAAGRASGLLTEGLALARLAAPIVAGLAASTGMMLVDTALVGPLGAVPLAALSLVSSVLVIFYAGLYGFAGPVGLFAGRAHGSGEKLKLGRVGRAGAMLTLGGGLVGAALMAAGLLALPRLGQPPEVVAVVSPYWLWMAATLVPYTVSLAPKLLLEATDRAWVAVALTLLALALKAPLSWALVHGRLGLPALGLTGAGVASFLATLSGALLLWGHVRLAPSLRPWWAEHDRPWAELTAQLREALPMAAQYFLEGAAVAVAGLLVGLLGAVALAANQVVLAVSSTLYMVPLGLAAAVSIHTAQAVGSGENRRVRPIGYAGLAMILAWMGLFAALYVLAGRAIAAAFTDDAQVVAAAAVIFVMFGLMQVADGVQSVALGALRGLLDNRWPTAVSLVAYWLVALPLAWFLGLRLGLGAPGVWAGFAIGLAGAAVALGWRFVRAVQRRPT